MMFGSCNFSQLASWPKIWGVWFGIYGVGGLKSMKRNVGVCESFLTSRWREVR